MEIEEAFGAILFEERKKRKLTHEKLSELSGLEVNTISFHERGLNTPNLKSVFKLAKALNVDPEYLITRTRDMMGE